MTNWIQKKLQSFVDKAKQTFNRKRASKKDQSDSMWINCPGCNKMQLKEDLIKNFNVCKCSHHFDLDPKTRFAKIFFDNGFYDLIDCPDWADPDPLNFKIGKIKFIDKYNAYRKKTGQQSAILVAKGKVNGLNIIAFGYNFNHGGAALTQRENEHLLAGIQKALDEKVDAVVSFYQSGGMAVTGNLNSLKNMPVQMMAMNMLKKAGIVTIGICGSKITGGTFCNVYGNDFIFAESPKSENILFSGRRVSASVNKGQELPPDFGQASSIVKHGMIDGTFESRLEIKDKITNLIRVLLKKSENEAKVKSTSSVKVDIPAVS